MLQLVVPVNAYECAAPTDHNRQKYNTPPPWLGYVLIVSWTDERQDANRRHRADVAANNADTCRPVMPVRRAVAS